MLSGEDFGYVRDNDNKNLGFIVKKSLMIGGVLFSIACFIYITVHAYYFVYSDRDNKIKVIRSPQEPIKIFDQNNSENIIKDIDKTIYDSIVGNKKLSNENLNQIKVINKAETPILGENKQQKIIVNQENQEKKPQTISNSSIVVYDPESKVNDAKPKQQIFSNTKPLTKSTTQTKSELTIRGVSRVQIAAMTSKTSATDYWTKLRKTYPDLFLNLSHFISEANLQTRGIFYRLQVGNFKNQVEAEEFCNKFILQTGKSKADCIIVE